MPRSVSIDMSPFQRSNFLFVRFVTAQMFPYSSSSICDRGGYWHGDPIA
ncbi:MAG: hypothetical protein WA865_14020 [Spirulinaceae cyanobacterium]